MAKDKLTEYSATNASNDVIGDISVAEGMLPSAVNNALREQMTHLKNFSDGTDAIDALAVDNLKLDGNTISSTDTNGDVTIDPNGTGDVVVAAVLTADGLTVDGTAQIGSDTAKVKFYSDSTYSGIFNGASLGSNENFYMGAGSLFFYGGGTERMRIDTSGILMVGKTSATITTAGQTVYFGQINGTRDAAQVCTFNRLSDDGTLVDLRQDSVQEGTISVSGTTVSYNGGHLARWSQLADGIRDETIVKGTVLTNLDQMAVWHHEAVAATYYVEGDELPEITPAAYYTEDDTLPEGVSVGDEKIAAVYAQIGDEKTPATDAYTEDNEQLNCMAVSSVEGDPNVAGVFVNWDNDDDEFNDMNIAMTGDMVIRIAQGTTVARGDLLMSAGDGTAKPQGDDIVRSKTIAKVTSTTVSHTYDDGTFLVPCVLMAC
jgi:hypothetical protein